jgi:hypothetical protein
MAGALIVKVPLYFRLTNFPRQGYNDRIELAQHLREHPALTVKQNLTFYSVSDTVKIKLKKK